MMGYLDRLNLRPFEKRLVIGVVVVVFIVLNFWFVVPHFSDLSQAKQHEAELWNKLRKMESETNQIPSYQKRINEMVHEGLDVPAEEQQNKFSSDIVAQQAASGVSTINNGHITPHTNSPFFVELVQNISVQSTETQLVDFIYQLGNGPSLIRVRGLSLHTDATHQQLIAGVTLVASYQKVLRARPAAGAQTGAAK